MAKDYTGLKFNRLKALHRYEENIRTRHPKWVFQCDCGNTVVAYIDNVVGGKTKSCGCLHTETLQKRNQKHGLPRNRLYFIWKTMRQRCSDPNKEHYERYGGRGIAVCDEWEDFAVFHKWAMANGYNDSLTLDRIDNNGNYEPSNCRWITHKEQMQNTKTTIFVEVNGERHSLSEWADISGTSHSTIYKRLKKGWTPMQAVFGK